MSGPCISRRSICTLQFAKRRQGSVYCSEVFDIIAGASSFDFFGMLPGESVECLSALTEHTTQYALCTR